MLYPSSVQKPTCSKIISDILTNKNDTSNKANITQLTQENFFNNPDYNKVYKNFDYAKSYDSWIYEGNKEDKIVGYKIFQSYPYNKVNFKIGDYIHWNYSHTELSTWLLTSLDTQYLYNVKGRMLLCNNSLRWEDSSGNLNCYPCVIKDALTYTNFKWGNTGVVESGGDIVVLVQRNQYTFKIDTNDRFIFNSVAFRVKQKFNELNPNYLELYMMKAPELPNDNLIDNIAINNNPNPIVIKNNIVLEPQIQEIMLNNTVEFNVYNYINKEKQNDTFSISINNVPRANYELNIIDGNNFTIKNVKQYIDNPIEIECIDNVTTEKINKTIWLGGNW